MTSARARAALLLYAAIQFVVLTTIAMWLYPGGSWARPWAAGYDFSRNFFSDLGATRAWSGAPNHAAMVLFSISLGTLGVAFVGFAGAWGEFAFSRRRARAFGLVAQGCGTLSGLAFLAVAATPVNLALDLHNGLVLSAFGLLLAYAASLVVVWWRNGAKLAQRATGVSYVAIVGAYCAFVGVAVHTGVSTEREWMAMVVAQKVIAYVSMLYIVYVAIVVCRYIRVET